MMTMEDIARLSGSSRSTVHAVLANKEWVSEATRKKILDIVARYHYQPNRLARALSRRATHLVALILKDIMNPFNSLVVDGVNSVLSAAKYSTLLLSTEDDHEREVQAVHAALSYQVDGIIITPQQVGVDLSHLWELTVQGKPLVTLGRIPGMRSSYVELAEEEAGRLATDHLLSMGHERVFMLRGPSTSVAAQGRLAGYKDALLSRGVRFDERMVVPAGATLREGRGAALQTLSGRDGGGSRPTAVVCYNDLVAAGVYRAAAELGIRIPDDLSVVGIDDIELASVFGPPLTTIAQPCFEMGKTMAEFLLAAIAEPEASPALSKSFVPFLIERGSVGRPRG
jgi:DNA-binding LacI/PurR family transcriptional regulator